MKSRQFIGLTFQVIAVNDNRSAKIDNLVINNDVPLRASVCAEEKEQHACPANLDIRDVP